MLKKILILVLMILYPYKVNAEDLLQILSKAFKNNSKLNAKRASLDAEKQDVNISRGDFLPSITLSGDAASQKDTNRKNQSGTSLQDANATPENRSVLIEQQIFSGFTNYNNLKKSKLEYEFAKFELNKLEQEVILSASLLFSEVASIKVGLSQNAVPSNHSYPCVSITIT